jgi:hypothetical protein
MFASIIESKYDVKNLCSGAFVTRITFRKILQSLSYFDF